ncbi:hypothetical protein Areg01_55240 [Actinoplanes regularis]|nr:hypothetical protein Areg01_55240 [Actinoplanes regularis]
MVGIADDDGLELFADEVVLAGAADSVDGLGAGVTSRTGAASSVVVVESFDTMAEVVR